MNEYTIIENHIDFLRYDEHDRFVDSTYVKFLDDFNAYRDIKFVFSFYGSWVDIHAEFRGETVIVGDILDGVMYESPNCPYMFTILIGDSATISNPKMSNNINRFNISSLPLTLELFENTLILTTSTHNIQLGDLTIVKSDILGIDLFKLMKERGILTIKY